MQMGGLAGTGMSILPGGPPVDVGVLKDGRRVWSCWAEAHEQLTDQAPIISLVDRHENLYFQHRGPAPSASRLAHSFCRR
jgi:hypothetical protein